MTRRARLCQLQCKDKFTAETFVLYPSPRTDAPIFGCEYLAIGDKKFFGGVDFHPLSTSIGYREKYIERFLGDFPDTTLEESKFYDLSTYFSNKFWVVKSDKDMYLEFLEKSFVYLERYKQMLASADITEGPNLVLHAKYDTHMAKNDPARGILKAYFSEEFAENYIYNFLFDLATP
jgi:15,16-dihydrobiliverdin:ferredoxin oxidoreductase